MYPIALAAITGGNLTDKMTALATRLLAHVHPDNGYASLSWDDTLAVCGVQTRGAAWKYLGRLKAAGIIHYSTNERVDIAFEAWRHCPPADSPRAASGQHEDAGADSTVRQRIVHAPLADSGIADSDEESRQRIVHAPLADSTRAENDTQLVGWLVIDPTTHLEDHNQPTKPKPGRVISEDEQRRNVALLTDLEVGVWRKDAATIAAQHNFDWVLRHVFCWREEMAAGKVSSVGALTYRLNKGLTPGDLTDRDRTTDLYRRHVSEDEDRARVATVYVPDEYAAIINT